jgi:hypothetical protein
LNANHHLRLVAGERNELETGTAIIRHFLGVPDDEPTELTFFCEGRIHIAHALTAADHIRLLHEGQKLRGFNGAYQLVNGPIDPALLARYESNKIHSGWNGRVGDRDIALRRAVFIDVDPVRPKGISATDDQKRAAWDVSQRVEQFLESAIGTNQATGHGDSGNGYFTLIAIEPVSPSKETTLKISQFLTLLNKKFGTEVVKIDASVFNAARLMPAPDTWKRKGQNTADRPHRMTSFCSRLGAARVPLEAIVG